MDGDISWIGPFHSRPWGKTRLVSPHSATSPQLVLTSALLAYDACRLALVFINRIIIFFFSLPTPIHPSLKDDVYVLAGSILPRIQDKLLFALVLCPHPECLPNYVLLPAAYALVIRKRRDLYAKQHHQQNPEAANDRWTTEMVETVIEGVGGIPASLWRDASARLEALLNRIGSDQHVQSVMDPTATSSSSTLHSLATAETMVGSNLGSLHSAEPDAIDWFGWDWGTRELWNEDGN